MCSVLFKVIQKHIMLTVSFPPVVQGTNVDPLKIIVLVVASSKTSKGRYKQALLLFCKNHKKAKGGGFEGLLSRKRLYAPATPTDGMGKQ